MAFACAALDYLVWNSGYVVAIHKERLKVIDVRTDAHIAHEMIDERDWVESFECPLSLSRSDDILILLEKMKERFPLKFASGEVLYHFTNAKAVYSMLSGMSDLTCTDYRYLNDTVEWMIGVDYVKNYIEKKFGSVRAEQFGDTVEACLSSKHYAPWVCSFSANSDKAALWAMYTDRDNGGYAIGLKKSHIERQVRMMNETNPCIEAYLLPCLYTDTDTDDIDGILEYVADFHSWDIEYNARHTPEEFGTLLLKYYLVMTYIIKDGSFDYENEWRLILRDTSTALAVQSLSIENSNLKLKHRVWSSLLKTGELINSGIEDIIVSPHPSSTIRNRVELVESLKRKHDYSYGIINSKSSYDVKNNPLRGD